MEIAGLLLCVFVDVPRHNICLVTLDHELLSEIVLLLVAQLMHPVLLERRFPHFDLISLSSYIILVEIRFLEHFLHHLVSQREFSLGFYKHQVLSLRCSDFSLIIFV